MAFGGNRAISAQAAYTEIVDPNGLTLKSDYELVDDDAQTDQSGTFQGAINKRKGVVEDELLAERDLGRMRSAIN